MYRSPLVSAAALLLAVCFASPDAVVADNNRFSIAQSLNNFDSRMMSAWSGGGGEIWNLEHSKGYPFAGRPYGSGDRSTIYGSRTYGSGYPQWSYPVSDPTTLAGLGFPYGAWPIPWAGDYAGSGEYGAASVDIFRPGGRMVQVPLKSSTKHWNISGVDEETYWIIGDRDSIISIMASMVDWCHAEAIWPETFDPAKDAIGVAGNATGQGVKFQPGNILQYYRASTFALAHPAYNNSYAHAPLNTSTLFTHDQSTSLNDVMKSSAWLKCINETIANALPILDAPPKFLSKGASNAIIVCVTVGPWFIMGLFWLWKSGFNYSTLINRIRQKKLAARNQRRRISDFQNYP